MKEIRLSCEVITPLFMGGANMEPEIRTQSINGVIRWWFRTLGGSKEEEKKLFGWTGQESKKGAVKFVVYKEPYNSRDIQSCLDSSKNGLNYLAFSLKRQNRQCLYVGYKFDLRIIFSTILEEKEKKKFLGALWCAFYLGNFGSRARRGFGSIMVKEISGDFDNFISFVPKGDIKECLRSNYKEIKSLFPKANNIEVYSFEKRDAKTVQDWVSEIQLRKGIDKRKIQKDKGSKCFVDDFNQQDLGDWDGLLNLMGYTLMAYRKCLGKYEVQVGKYKVQDCYFARNIIQSQGKLQNFTEKPIIQRAIFGLPLNFYFLSIKQGNNRGTVFPVKGGEKLRRASPLIYKVIKNEEKLEGLIIFVMDKFLPDDVDLELNGVKLQKPDYTLIKDYLQSLQDKKIIGRLI